MFSQTNMSVYYFGLNRSINLVLQPCFYNHEFDNIQSVILQTIIDYALNILRTPIQNGSSQLNLVWVPNNVYPS